jgi:uncharacterized membrane protein YcaP (DUF421 family)
MDPGQLLLIALRASIIYFFLLIVIRILGKREVGNITAFDLIVALIMGEMTDEAIFGDITLTQAFVATVTVAVWHVANSFASFKNATLAKILGSSPTLLIEHGRKVDENLAKERIAEEELLAELRLMGIDELTEIKRATLEPNGAISVIKEDWAKPVQKYDLNELSKGKK